MGSGPPALQGFEHALVGKAQIELFAQLMQRGDAAERVADLVRDRARQHLAGGGARLVDQLAGALGVVDRRFDLPAMPDNARVLKKTLEKSPESTNGGDGKVVFYGLCVGKFNLDAVLDQAMSTEPLKHYRPWIEDVRTEKPYQLEDRVEELFHEKSVTGRGACP